MYRIENINCLTELEDRLRTAIKMQPDMKFLELSNNCLDFFYNVFSPKFANLTSLLLNRCNLESINSLAFSDLVNLIEIDLQRNRLRTLDDRLFDFNRKLQILNVSRNKLKTFSNRLIRNLTKLDILKLSDNCLEQFFGMLSGTMTDLDLSGNLLEEFDCLFLPKLQYLSLASNKLRQFAQSDKDFLNHSIIRLILDSNRIETLDPNQFTKAINLRKLCLCNNFIMDFDDNQFAKLHSLTHLCISNNNLRLIRESWLRNCRALHSLSFDNNRIDQIENNTFAKLIKLKDFSLNSNKSETLLRITNHWFRHNRRLKSLSFQNSQISEIENDSFINLNRLEMLDLSENFLEKLPERFLARGKFNLNVLILDQNPLTDHRTSPFRLLQINETISGRIYFLGLSHTFIAHFDQFSFYGLTIEYLSIVHCGLSIDFQFDFKHVSGLKNLHLSSNRFRAYECRRGTVAAAKTGSLTTNFKACRFFSQPLLTASTNSLEELFLANCEIDYVPDYFFDHLEFVKVLDLSSNRLTAVDRCLDPLVNLIRLNLRSNRLRNFNENPFELNKKLLDLNLIDNCLTELKRIYVDGIVEVMLDETCALI